MSSCQLSSWFARVADLLSSLEDAHNKLADANDELVNLYNFLFFYGKSDGDKSGRVGRERGSWFGGGQRGNVCVCVCVCVSVLVCECIDKLQGKRRERPLPPNAISPPSPSSQPLSHLPVPSG